MGSGDNPCSGVLEHFTMAIFYFSCYINGKLKSTNSCEVDMNVEKWAIIIIIIILLFI